jgi:MFS family permease
VKHIAPNILKYYVLRLFSGLVFTYTIKAIFLLGRGITLAELATFASLIIIFSTLLEIPTGYIADRFGRKFSVSLSYCIQVLALLGFIFVTDFRMLIVIAFLTGLSSALESGALESLIYEEIQQTVGETNFLKITSRGTNIVQI